MPSKYLSALLLLLSVFTTRAQNIPDLNATAPAGTATAAITVPPNLSTTASPSWEKTYIPKLPQTNAANINSNGSPEAVQMTTVYKDGFNRPVQSVQHHATTGSRPHLVAPFDTRFQPEGANFLPYAASDVDYHSNLFALQQYYYTNTAYPGEQYTAYSINKNISNAGQRGVKSLVPGLSFAGQNRGGTVKQVTNVAREIKIWEPDADGKPVLAGTYAAGMLLGQQAYDTMGALVTTYNDRDGRLICQTVKQEDQTSGGNVVTIYGTTYYVYDVMGRLVCTMPPKATAASVTAVSPTVFDNLCFRYQYDDKGRLVGKRFPGESDFTEIVYDGKDRVVMRRNPNEKVANQWEVIFYDAQGRVKATSLLANANNRITWQNLMDAGNNTTDLTYYLLTPEGEAEYPDEGSIAGNTIMSYTYYDDYSQTDPGDSKWDACQSALSFTETFNSDGAEQPLRGGQTRGLVTGSRIRILTAPGANAAKTGDWRESVNYYDKKARIIFTAGQDLYQHTAIHTHYTGSQFDFADRLLISKHRMTNLLDNQSMKEHTEWNRNEYEALTGRLKKTWRQTDTGIWQVQSLYSYDELGRVKREVLGNYGEVRDYKYDIRGQLTAINDYYTRTGDRQGESRSFGESLGFDYGFTQPRYDGKVSGMMWRGAGSSLANAYGYSYDYSGRLTNAEYRRYEPPSGTFLGYAWRKDLADYTVSNLKYDQDGNIKNMNQQGVKPGGAIIQMDRLVYSYENAEQSNRLYKVVDGAAFYHLGDFNNANGINASYTYDPNGNLIKDGNKGITGVSYTHFDKPQVITFNGGKSILYSYDAAGNKVQELINDNGNLTKTDYVGNYIYKNDDLQYTLTTEGRSIFDKAKGRFTEQYFAKDHLSNIRSVIEVYTPPIQEYLGSYEIASANIEGLFFDHHNEVRDDKPGGVPGDNKAGNLNGAYPTRRIGTSMLMHVMAGDKVEMNVNNFFEQYEPENDNPVNAEDMLATIVSTLSGGSGGFVGSETHNTKTVGDVFTSDNYSIFDQVLNSNTDARLPRAYLNYVLFDENMHIYPGMSGAFQADGAGTWTQIGTSIPLELPVNGYLAVYLSNASKNIAADQYGNVYFDQLVIRLSRGKLKEEAHYYPHGLPIAGIGSVANGYVTNRKKYQSNEYIQESGLNWMDFQARQYDPQIGRFLGVDPLAASKGQEIQSSYVAMGNNPGMMVDPDGTYFSFATPGLQTAFNNLQQENNDKIDAYNKELRGLDLLSANKDVQNRIQQINKLIDMHTTFKNQLKAMSESPVEFHISNNSPNGNAAASTSYNFDESRVQFNMGGDSPWNATLAHELRHGYGYLVGEIIVSTYAPNQFYDMVDEVAGNLTGLLFTSAPNRAVDGSYGIDNFRPSTEPGRTYPHLAGKDEQLSVNTPISVFQKYFKDNLIDSYQKHSGNVNATVGDALNDINSRVKNGRPRYMWGDLLKK